VITGGKGGDTLTGNGGNDTFSFVAGDSSIGTGKFDTITDFVANTRGVGTDGALNELGATGVAVADLTGDVLSFAAAGTGAGGIIVDVLTNAADATTFLANNFGADTAVAALDSSSGNLYVDNTGDGVADFFIKLAGVTTIDTGAFVLV
jgi:Ca2+-binding RTX toxin-like protein